MVDGYFYRLEVGGIQRDEAYDVSEMTNLGASWLPDPAGPILPIYVRIPVPPAEAKTECDGKTKKPFSLLTVRPLWTGRSCIWRVGLEKIGPSCMPAGGHNSNLMTLPITYLN